MPYIPKSVYFSKKKIWKRKKMKGERAVRAFEVSIDGGRVVTVGHSNGAVAKYLGCTAPDLCPMPIKFAHGTGTVYAAVSMHFEPKGEGEIPLLDETLVISGHGLRIPFALGTFLVMRFAEDGEDKYAGLTERDTEMMKGFMREDENGASYLLTLMAED